ncbi:MAG: dTDP-glucose 4,6-dehydratase [Actinomycetota bacterium]|nr:dTDP-glucose 4,6-dehydratase [Actinomycetota bacterium]
MTGPVLITGGAGFLGSHVCERFLAQGKEVLCLDNFITGAARNVEHLRDDPRFTLVEHDITKPYAAEPAPSLVVHMASPASPPAYLANPIPTLEVGSVGTINALNIARAANAPLLLTSTSEVYGDPEVNPQPESYRGNVSCTGPRSVYDEAKRYAEAAVMAYHRSYGLDTKIVRIFNTYGPRLAPGDGRAIPNFVKQALEGSPITIYGDGSQTRSFCYVDDLVRGILSLAESDEHDPVNLGNPDERTISELAQLILEYTGSSSEIVYRDLPEDDPKVRCPDITRARQILSWEPQVPLEEGLPRSIEWYRSEIGAS